MVRIPFDPDPAAEHLVDGEGAPVWPIRSAEDRAALGAIAELFAAELVPCRGRPGAPRAAGSGEVVALGAEQEAEARLHAHLTGRRFGGVRTARQLAAEAPPAVVVTRLGELDPALVAALHAGGAAPGLVLAGATGSLRRQVLQRAAAGRLRTRPAVARADLHPFSPRPAAGRLAAGLGDGAAQVRAVLAAGAGVLSVLTHADGVDASLGELVLCPLADPVAGADPARSPSCWSSGTCHRLARPLGDALAGGRLVRAEEIRCRVLLWNACFTLAHADDPLDPRWGILARLLSAPGIGAVVVAPDLSHDSPGSLEPLAAALAGGARLGDAVAEHNRHPLRAAVGARLLLFGDPDLALAPGEAEAARPPAPPAARERPPATGWPMLETLIAAEEGSPAFFADPARAARAALERGDAQEIRERFADLLACRVRAFTQWSSLSDPAGLRGRTAPCPRCGAPARQMGHALRPAGLLPRRVTVCPRCQVVEDVPLACDLTLALEGDEVVIAGTLPRAGWAARARLYAQVPWNGPLVRWPAAADGSPARRARIGAPAASGVHQILFALVSGREYAALSARAPLAAAARLEKAS